MGLTVKADSVAGSGQYTGHWGGDNESKWGAMFLSISQALTFMMAGIPMFGTDTCGFSNSVNATEELCARWMELNAFFPFYRYVAPINGAVVGKVHLGWIKRLTRNVQESLR